MKKKELKTQKQQEAIKQLKEYIKPSTKLIIFITKVSSSGMNRHMQVYITNGKNKSLSRFTYLIADACDMTSNDDGIRVGGCGMDMAFWLADHITYSLGYKGNKNLKGNSGSCLDWQAIY